MSDGSDGACRMLLNDKSSELPRKNRFTLTIYTGRGSRHIRTPAQLLVLDSRAQTIVVHVQLFQLAQALEGFWRDGGGEVVLPQTETLKVRKTTERQTRKRGRLQSQVLELEVLPVSFPLDSSWSDQAEGETHFRVVRIASEKVFVRLVAISTSM